MNIALYGATGKAGSRILAELLNRGHNVTAIARSPAKLKPHPHLNPLTSLAGTLFTTCAHIITGGLRSSSVPSLPSPQLR